jgi:hypothetical protein
MEGWSIYCAFGPFELTWNFGRKPQWLPNELAESIPPPNEGADPVAHPKAENGEAVWGEYRFDIEGFFGWLYIVLLSGKRAVSKGARQEGWERIGVRKMHWSAFYHVESEMDNLLLR